MTPNLKINFKTNFNITLKKKPKRIKSYCTLPQLNQYFSDAITHYLHTHYPTLHEFRKQGKHKKVLPLFELNTGKIVAGSLFSNQQPLQNICAFVATLPESLTTIQFEAYLQNTPLSNREKALSRWLYWCPHLPIAPLLTIDNPTQSPILIQTLATMTVSDWIHVHKTQSNHPKTRHHTINLARQCITIVAKLHRHGYAHRDIKPNNIFLYGNTLKLGDLDCMTATHTHSPQTTTYAQLFQAPEIGKPTHWNAIKTDAFALGLTLICLFYKTIIPPPLFRNWHTSNQDSTPPLDKTYIPTKWIPIIKGLLHKNPHNRFSAMDAQARIAYTI